MIFKDINNIIKKLKNREVVNMKMFYKTKTGNRGFTLIEVFAVLIIIGIISAIAVSRSVNYDTEVYAGADALKSHLRYAQTMAMNSNLCSGTSAWGVSGTADSYWLFQVSNPSTYVYLPDNDKFINADKSINIEAKKLKLTSGFTVYFDNRGIPYSAYTDATTNTPLTADMIINVQPHNAAYPDIAVTIKPLTGYIP